MWGCRGSMCNPKPKPPKNLKPCMWKWAPVGRAAADMGGLVLPCACGSMHALHCVHSADDDRDRESGAEQGSRHASLLERWVAA